MLYACSYCNSRIRSYEKITSCANCGMSFGEIKYFKPFYTRTKVKCNDCGVVALVNVKSSSKLECPSCHSSNAEPAGPGVATSIKEWRIDRKKKAIKKTQLRINSLTQQLMSDLNVLGVPRHIRKEIDEALRNAVSDRSANG